MKVADKHGKIIQAAIRVFARNGFFNSRISEIAQEANVADGTIYLYFNNKYDILITIFEEEMGKIIARVKQEIARFDDPRDKLEHFALLHLSLVEKDKELAELIQVELRQSSKFIKEYRNRRFAEYLHIIGLILKEGQKKGIFSKDVRAGIFKRAFFGALDEMSRFWVLSSKKKYSVKIAAKQISRYFLDGILEKAEKPAPKKKKNSRKRQTSP